ncbi:UNVERIFIED_CONTAM: F-box protein CPR1 [Sesamum radiatum]|uniref:F-box protein CPR1 n=1 Tax=Sesamum radiatum TaxID=300843 RepID=A0AAW2NCV9_SESRA
METRENSQSSIYDHNHPPRTTKTRRRIHTPEAGSIPIFPEEIIVEILSRLSVRCLLKFSLKQCSLNSLLSEPVADAADFDYPMKNPNNSVRADDEGFVHYKYGFGFDECNDDYKVLGIFSGFCTAGRYETRVKVYSLRANSWKRILVFKDGLPFDDTGKFVSGKLHWGRRVGFNSRWEIVSFDLGSEVCGKVEQPRYIEGGFSPSLGVLGGCLCVLCDFPKTSVDVWILRDYGKRDSWDKLVTVPYDLGDPWKGPYSTPLCRGAKGEILLVYGSSFIVYDPKDNAFHRPKITNFDTFLEADVYVESLVSLVPDAAPKIQNQKKHGIGYAGGFLRVVVSVLSVLLTFSISVFLPGLSLLMTRICLCFLNVFTKNKEHIAPKSQNFHGEVGCLLFDVRLKFISLPT